MITPLARCAFLFAALFFSCLASAGMTKWIPFDLENGHIVVDIVLAGEPAKAILDTGAEMNGISHKFIEKYQPDVTRAGRTRILGAYGEDIRDRYNNVPVTLFGVELELDKLVNLNFGDAEKALLLGAGFFDDFIVQIDYPNQRMRLIDQESLDLAKLRNIRVERDAASYMPLVNVTLNNEEDVWLMFDTGMNGGILIERRVVRNNGWLDTFSTVRAGSSGVTRQQEIDSFRLPSVKFGPFELENVIVSTPIEGQDITFNNRVGKKEKAGSRIKGNKVEGLLGYDVLKHFVITMDYDDGYMHIGLPEE